jgi:hypothetical protein
MLSCLFIVLSSFETEKIIIKDVKMKEESSFSFNAYHINNMWPTQQDYRNIKFSALLGFGMLVMYLGVNWILNDDDEEEEDMRLKTQNNSLNAKSKRVENNNHKGFFDHISSSENEGENNNNNKNSGTSSSSSSSSSLTTPSGGASKNPGVEKKKPGGMGNKVASRSCLRKNVSMPNLSSAEKELAHEPPSKGIKFSSTASIVKIGKNSFDLVKAFF